MSAKGLLAFLIACCIAVLLLIVVMLVNDAEQVTANAAAKRKHAEKAEKAEQVERKARADRAVEEKRMAAVLERMRPPLPEFSPPAPVQVPLPTSVSAMSAKEIFAKLSRSVVQIQVDRGSGLVNAGSGVSVQTGYIVTNLHVVIGARAAAFVREDRVQEHFLGLSRVDGDADLALLRVSSDVPVIPIAARKPDVGSKAFTLGFPLGLASVIGEGLVGGYSDNLGLEKVLTSAPISPGSSGGALIDENGELVGITTSFFVRGQNLNTAIRADRVEEMLRKAKPGLYAPITILSR